MRSGSAAGVGEGAVFAGAVVADRVAADELLADGDLDGAHRRPRLGPGGGLVLRADAVVRPGEATRCPTSRPCGSPTGRPSPAAVAVAARRPCRGAAPACLLGRAVAPGVGGDEHTAMVDAARARRRRHVDGLHRRATPRPDTRRAAKLIVPLRADPSRGRRHRFVDRVGSIGCRARFGRVGEPEPFPRHRHPDALMRPLDSCSSRTHASSCACASSIESNTLPFKNSRRSVLCHRSTLPVVVGDRGAVSRCA